MSFFDELGKKISDAGQETTTRAKNFAEINKINGLIGSAEKQIINLYTAIGEAYYQRHCNDEMPEEKEKIQQITFDFQQIEQYREQIRIIKGVDKCPNCGIEVSNTAAFCNACGAKIIRSEISSIPQTSGKVCPKCNATLRENAVFCSVCGEKLAEETGNIF